MSTIFIRNNQIKSIFDDKKDSYVQYTYLVYKSKLITLHLCHHRIYTITRDKKRKKM